MRGNVKVYQLNGNLIAEESNLIVDGMKEHIVDMMTWIPSPSAVESDVSASYEVSNFTIQAMTFGPAAPSVERTNSLLMASGYTVTGDPSSFGVSAFDKGDKAYTYAKNIPNFFFSAVNAPNVSASTNSVFVNPSITTYEETLTNAKFRDYALDTNLSGSFVNSILELYELNGWDITSYLRFAPSGGDYIDTYKAASVARSDFSSVSGIYTNLSSFVEPDDGVLYIRSWQVSSDAESSSLPALAQTFAFDVNKYKPLSDVASATMVAEATCQFSAVSGATGAIHVSVEDKTEGEFYHFSGDGTYDRHSWGGGGSPLVRGSLTDGTSGVISTFFNIPNDKIGNVFEVTYKFYTSDNAEPFFVYLWEAGIRQPEGWYFGNIQTDSDIHRIINDDYQNPATYFAASSVGANPTATNLSSVTYLSQNVRLKPLKKYAFSPILSGSWGGNSDLTYAGVVKWVPSNVRDRGNFNLLCEGAGGRFINETRLDDSNASQTGARYVVKPTISHLNTIHDADVYKENVKPSDLCLEFSGARTGSFIGRRGTGVRLKFKSLYAHENGLQSGNVEVKVRSARQNPDGDFLYYNFIENAWTTSSTGVSLHTSSLSAADGEFYEYSSPEFRIDPLIGVTTDPGATSSLVYVTFEGNTSSYGFVKHISVDSLAPSGLSPEVFRFAKESTLGTGAASYAWLQRDVSRDLIFSGLDFSSVVPVYIDFGNYTSSRNVDAMFASSATVTDENAEYEFFLMHSNLDSAGDFITVKATLNDAALVLSEEEIDGDIITSEDYLNKPFFNIIGQPYFAFTDLSGPYSPEIFSKGVGAGVNFITSSYDKFPATKGVCMAYPYNTYGLTHPKGKLAYACDVSSLDLVLSSTKMAFSIEYNSTDTEPSEVSWQAAALTKSGETVWWDGSDWEYYDISAQPFLSFDHTIQPGDLTGVIKTAFTEEFEVTDNNLEKIIFYVVYKGLPLAASNSQGNNLFLTNWRLYHVNETGLDHLPEFPDAEDRTIQSPVEQNAPYGHYTNEVEFYESLTSITLEESLGKLTFPPHSLTAPNGNKFSISSTAGFSRVDSYCNQFGVLNSEGFLLFGYDGAFLDEVYIQGFGAEATTSSMVYTVDLIKNLNTGDYREYRALERQGGVAAIGLWVLDLPATYKKLADNGHSLSSIYDVPGTGSKLYNLTDETRNPVFKLASKKVFRQAITVPEDLTDNEGLRIVWEINFL